jgi:hypothetical protein
VIGLRRTEGKLRRAIFLAATAGFSMARKWRRARPRLPAVFRKKHPRLPAASEKL